MKKSNKTQSEKETRELAKALARELRPGDTVFLQGDLGSGKTTFVKGLAEGLGFKHPDEVKSPTFVILHVYQGRIPLYHFDLYRLETEAELETLGFEEFLQDPKGISCIEWPEKAHSYASTRKIRVRFEILGPDTRKIEIRMDP